MQEMMVLLTVAMSLLGATLWGLVRPALLVEEDEGLSTAMMVDASTFMVSL